MSTKKIDIIRHIPKDFGELKITGVYVESTPIESRVHKMYRAIFCVKMGKRHLLLETPITRFYPIKCLEQGTIIWN